MKNLIYFAILTLERSIRIVKATALSDKRQVRIKILIFTKTACHSVEIYPSAHKNPDHENSGVTLPVHCSVAKIPKHA